MDATWDWKGFYTAFIDPELAYIRDYFSFRIQENPQSPVGVAMMFKVRATVAVPRYL